MWESNKVILGNHFSNEVGLDNNLCHAIENRLSCVPSHGNMAARLYEGRGGLVYPSAAPPVYGVWGAGEGGRGVPGGG